ncbi:hypothetical protein AXF42_Ash003838 [Apostasia shenzhenica]|uniref:J domain-containing protein n=1 Tax=Apostasia shenzhenica TaxID=1088818 RepID=A0A2I0AI38_9ASPA|nr:hypothetical protein AXF42_Ash003838 [Apostasia shenzhenica]
METGSSQARERKHWWLTNRKMLDKYLREARSLLATQESSGAAAALGLLDAALAISPRMEAALELKARSLLFLHRFREVADMLHHYIPSCRASSSAATGEDSSTSLSSGSIGSAAELRERTKLLPSGDEDERSYRCFSITDLKRKVVAGLYRGCDAEGQWRYLALGQACYHLGLLDDAMVLLQTGRRLATAAFRRESVSLSDDMFTFSATIRPLAVANGGAGGSASAAPPAPNSPLSEAETAAHLLSHIKLLLRRLAAATSALDACLPNEAARHFSKILEGRRGTPHAFAANCLIRRAAAYCITGRVADAIADCNRALALEPTSIPALRARADLLESVRCLPDCLRDLDHLKLLYDAILRDRKLPGPPWRPSHTQVRYREIPASLQALTARISAIRQRVAAGDGYDVDYHKLIGVRRGCSRSELERAYLLLSLRHKPDKSGSFVDRLEYDDEHRDVEAVRDQARMSALILYRMLQKGFSSIMTAIVDEEAAEKQRAMEVKAKAAAAAAAAAAVALPEKQLPVPPPSVYQGVFCRDLATVGSMLSRALPVKYEALSC